MAENLSSKRTNHKLAEQGRRNRINTALKEIENLLPPSLAAERCKDKEKNSEPGATGSSKSPDKPASNQPISKASTVELAIVYIKNLQKELAETKQKLKDAETKLESTSPNIEGLEMKKANTPTEPAKADNEDVSAPTESKTTEA